MTNIAMENGPFIGDVPLWNAWETLYVAPTGPAPHWIGHIDRKYGYPKRSVARSLLTTSRSKLESIRCHRKHMGNQMGSRQRFSPEESIHWMNPVVCQETNLEFMWLKPMMVQFNGISCGLSVKLSVCYGKSCVCTFIPLDSWIHKAPVYVWWNVKCFIFPG